MVQFGKKLLSERHQEWNEYYINYSDLKFLIKKAKRQQKKSQEQRRISGSSDKRTVESGEPAAEQEPLLVPPTKTDDKKDKSKKSHKKNTSSLGNILDLMQSSSNDLGFDGNANAKHHHHPFLEDSDATLPTENATTNLPLLPIFDRSSKDFQHYVREGYLGALEFRMALDQEIEKLVLFSLSQEGTLAQKFLELSKKRLQLREQVYSTMWSVTSATQDVEGNPSASTKLQDCYTTLERLTTANRDFAQLLLQLVDFMDINVTALRKILKKHDKNFPHFKLSANYLREHLNIDSKEDGDLSSSRQPGARQYLQQIYHFGGLSSLIYALQSAFDELHSMEWNLMAVQYQVEKLQRHRRSKTLPSSDLLPPPHPPTSTSTTNYGSMLQSPVKAHKKTPKLDNRKDYPATLPPPPPPPPTSGGFSPLMRPPRNSRGLTATLTSPLRSLFKRSSSTRSPLMLRPLLNATTTITRAHEPILDDIYAARSRLKETTQYAQYVAAQGLVFDDTEDQFPDSKKKAASEFTFAQNISSLLNLASCFLYMTNYYVVAPTVGNYAELLGSSESMSGIIIGMTPNAALLATVLYGWWSNYSYRHALLFAQCSSVLGNVLYALALHYDSLTMVLLGRFFNGFGSARSINRRYIADTFSKADRTAASADFVTSGALGMAAGPAIAFVLGHVQFPLGNTYWSAETAPGWIMLGLWSIFFVLSLVFFQEPDRSHLFDSTKDDDALKATEEEQDTDNNSQSKTSGDRIELSETPVIDRLSRVPSGDSEITLDDSTVDKTKKEQPLWKNAAVMNSLWLYFVLKLVLEMLLSSTPTVTKFYFGWQSKKSGLFMMFMALLMFPANMIVARLSQHYEDRELILWALIMMLISVLGILDYTSYYPAAQYVFFAVGIFISTNSLEGPNMGLLSKTIPKSWAKGTFNSGFLATEAGTLARSVGDVLISGIAGSLGMSMLLNGLFLPMSVLVGISLLLVRKYYSQLTDADEDDDDDDTASLASLSLESIRNAD